MKNKILIFGILVLSAIYVINAVALDFNVPSPPPHHSHSHQKQIDEMFQKRLNLTESQIEYININRPIHREQMKQKFDKIRQAYDEIKNVYQTKPKFEADVITIPMKAKLAILKQDAYRQKMKNRKNFEKILTEEQKVELEKFRYELKEKRNQK